MAQRASRVTRRMTGTSRPVMATAGGSVALDERGQLEAFFMHRVTELAAHVRRKVSDEVLRRAARAGSDLEALVVALMASPSLLQDDPLQAAQVRGLALRGQLEREAGGFLSTQQVAHLLGMSVPAVHKRLKARRLLAVEREKRGLALPSFQFTSEGEVLPGLPEVLAVLAEGGSEGWAAVHFLLTENARLESAVPAAVLREGGQVDAVLRAARAWGEHGAD